VCVCMYIHSHSHTHACMHTDTCTHAHTLTHARMHTHSHTHTCTHTHTRTHAHTLACMHLHTHRHNEPYSSLTNTFKHTCTNTWTLFVFFAREKGVYTYFHASSRHIHPNDTYRIHARIQAHKRHQHTPYMQLYTCTQIMSVKHTEQYPGGTPAHCNGALATVHGFPGLKPPTH
jgi:hypothetical protein